MKTARQIFKKFHADQSGLTLIDLAIFLLVVGILITPMIQGYKIWLKYSLNDTTDAYMLDVTTAIDNHFEKYGFYPCPADPTLGPDDNNYGEENKDGAGVCNAPVNAGIVTGSVPFKVLNLTSTQTLDGYKYKMAYTVTATQTQQATFDEAQGAISILAKPDQTDASVPAPIAPQMGTTGFHYLVVSLGQNGKGAYTENGGANPLIACPTDNTIRENENCNGDNIFISPQFLTSDVDNNRHFDDKISAYISKIEAKKWKEQSDPVDNDVTNVGTENVLIGMGTADPQYAIDIVGNVKTDPNNPEQGNIIASDYCDAVEIAGQSEEQNAAQENECFSASRLAGNDAEMQCANGAISGIGSARVNCEDTLTISTEDFGDLTCDQDGEYAAGFDADGNVICRAGE